MSSRHVETIQLETVISLASLTLKVFENRLYVFDISLIVPIANMHSSLILDSLYIYIYIIYYPYNNNYKAAMTTPIPDKPDKRN